MRGGKNVSTWTNVIGSGYRFATGGSRSDANPTRWCSRRLSMRAASDTHSRSSASPQDIVEEAKCLWATESKKGSECGVSASWGCVGLLPNPDSTRLPSKQLSRWRDFVKECAERRSNYRALAAADAGIDKEGVLKIRWPMLDAGSTLPFDALLATATEPTMHDSGCPSPHDIAAAWKTTKGKQEVDYFWKNRKHRIWTFRTTRSPVICRILTTRADTLQVAPRSASSATKPLGSTVRDGHQYGGRETVEECSRMGETLGAVSRGERQMDEIDKEIVVKYYPGFPF